MGRRAPVSFRVNPDVDPKTHPYISTGLKESKFGVAFADAPALYRHAAQLPHIAVRGLDIHIGSQITELAPYREAARKVLDLVDRLAADGIDLATSDSAYIFNSSFDAGDDCINFNAGVGADGVKENYPDNNIRVFNCIAKRGHGGVVFGSFTAAWIQNVLVEDCVFDGTDIGIRFKTGTKQGGGARNVLCRDITIKNIAKNSAIFFDSSYSCDYPSGGPGQFKDITVKNITCTNLKKYGIYVSGLAGTPHTNLSLSNVSIDGGTAGGAYIKYCADSTFDTINITNSTPPWTIDANSTAGLTFKNCSPSPKPVSE